MGLFACVASVSSLVVECVVDKGTKDSSIVWGTWFIYNKVKERDGLCFCFRLWEEV